ncbi:MAG: DUF72 domain-containing protein [Hydrogenophilaceae bacterium]|nr:DUF72 domain-containing protein [Hydrogenophilaceae bacterium]
MSYAVYLGAAGWDHPSWQGAFYPEEMPAEWRLAFYNTLYRCVYLERAAWADLASEIWAQWAQETQEDFRFILEASESGGRDAAAAEAFGGRAVLVDSATDARLLWFDAATALRPLADRLRSQWGQAPVYLISRDADLSRLAEVRAMLDLMGL